MLFAVNDWVSVFQPTLPARGATHLVMRTLQRLQLFQPTLPARGATRRRRVRYCRPVYFNPRSPHGERPADPAPGTATPEISTHAPRTGSDAMHTRRTVQQADFNPRSPHGERRHASGSAAESADFNPRSPHGERPDWRGRHRRCGAFQPTLPARGATAFVPRIFACGVISTHAPRTGSDGFSVCVAEPHIYFNPRSPHGERLSSTSSMSSAVVFQPTLPARGATAILRLARNWTFSFQPTLPARGATPNQPSAPPSFANFNPRSPHGERPFCDFSPAQARNFNPRSPHGERRTRWIPCPATAYFNPRSPHGERRAAAPTEKQRALISTHAPRTGSDVIPSPISAPNSTDFNPRSPHGERPACPCPVLVQAGFQPTLPARGATLRRTVTPPEQLISTHAPRTGSDGP